MAIIQRDFTSLEYVAFGKQQLYLNYFQKLSTADQGTFRAEVKNFNCAKCSRKVVQQLFSIAIKMRSDHFCQLRLTSHQRRITSIFRGRFRLKLLIQMARSKTKTSLISSWSRLPQLLAKASQASLRITTAVKLRMIKSNQ